MKIVNAQTEKEYRDTQNEFGHMGHSQTLSSWLETTYSLDLIRKNRYLRVAKRFLDTKKTFHVLEVAAGVGDFVMFCQKNFPQHVFFAHELSEKQLKGNIADVAEYFGESKIPPLSFSPAEALEYPDEKFDVIFIKAAVHHFENLNASFSEIHRILKPDGKVIFFEDPVCLDIPIYKQYVKKNFSKEERNIGINEHIYTTREYLSFGDKFSKAYYFLDEELVDEYVRQQSKRIGIKSFVGNIIMKYKSVFRLFMVWRFSPLIFVFEK